MIARKCLGCNKIYKEPDSSKDTFTTIDPSEMTDEVLKEELLKLKEENNINSLGRRTLEELEDEN